MRPNFTKKLLATACTMALAIGPAINPYEAYAATQGHWALPPQVLSTSTSLNRPALKSAACPTCSWRPGKRRMAMSF